MPRQSIVTNVIVYVPLPFSEVTATHMLKRSYYFSSFHQTARIVFEMSIIMIFSRA